VERHRSFDPHDTENIHLPVERRVHNHRDRLPVLDRLELVSIETDIRPEVDGPDRARLGLSRAQRHRCSDAQSERFRHDDHNNPRGVFISSDGNWVGYFADGLKTVSILGGPPVTICEPPAGAPRGASWGDDDTVVFATAGSSGLWRVPAGGGEPEELTALEPEQGNHLWPEILPGVRWCSSR